MTPERARELLDYDPDTGIVKRKSTGKVFSAKYTQLIGLDGKNYLLGRIIWLMSYNKWPEHKIGRLDGDIENFRLANLADQEDFQILGNVKRYKKIAWTKVILSVAISALKEKTNDFETALKEVSDQYKADPEFLRKAYVEILHLSKSTL